MVQSQTIWAVQLLLITTSISGTSVRRPVPLSNTRPFSLGLLSLNLPVLDILHTLEPYNICFWPPSRMRACCFRSFPSVGSQPPFEKLLLKRAAVDWLCSLIIFSLLCDCREPRVSPPWNETGGLSYGNPWINGFSRLKGCVTAVRWTATPRTG